MSSGFTFTRLNLCAWLWFALITVATIVANSQNNRFPFWYHPDEETKATQIMQDSRNFTHPQLLLDGVMVAVKLRETRMERQQVVQAGRKVSATYLGLAVGFMALLAWRLGGPLASVLSGLLLHVQPLMIELAHYLKEDTALVMGWALAMLASSFFWERPDAKRLLFFGAACGVCAAGKYVGAFVLALGLTVAVIRSPGRRWKAALGFVGVALLVWCALNFKIFTNLEKTSLVLGREIQRVLGVETAVDPPWLQLVKELSWAGGLIALVAVYRVLRDRASFSAPERISLLAAALYFVPVSFTMRMVPRYMLPIYMTVWWAAGLTLAWFILRAPLQRNIRIALGVLLALAALAAQGLAGWKVHLGFAGPDTRVAMARYIDANLPPDAFVAYEMGAKLPDKSKKERRFKGFAPRQRMIYLDRYRNPPPTPTMVERLNADGIAYLVVNMSMVDHYMTANFTQDFGQFGDFKYRRPFYETLFKQQPVHVEPAGPGNFISPELRLYKIPDAQPR